MRLQLPLALLLLATAGITSAQSLGELAQKEKERRKAAAGAGSQSYTNDDLPKGKPASSPSPAPGKGAATPRPGAPPPAATSDLAASESSWRQQAQSARDAITAAEQGVAQAEKALGSVRTGVSQPLPSDGLRQTPPNGMLKEPSHEDAERNLAAARAALAQAKAAFADLEERARRASIPPGWLR